MYEQLKNLQTQEQVEAITRHLVGLNSINGTLGEVRIVQEIYRILSTFPYFQQHPENLWLQKIPNDPIGRQNVFAFVNGMRPSPQTILYHSHIDTVAVEDFGALKEHAFSPDELENFFCTYDNDPELQAEAQSGDWMFGRGSVDMKSGAAVHIANILYFSEHREQLEGNVLLLCNGDEESEHRGMVGALNELNRIQHEYGIHFITAINTDFITPLYDNDPNRYIYTGAAGKILPCFHIYGREVHVGDTLSGIDPNFISAKLTERIHNQYKLAEKIPGEMVLPPTVLKQRDMKELYTVQTAISSHLYFNCFIYEDSVATILEKFMHEAKEACLEAEAYLEAQFEEYIQVTGLPTRDLSWKVDVTTYEEYVAYLTSRGIDTRAIIEEVLAGTQIEDLRDLSFEIVSALQAADPEKKARVILFFAPPFLPHNYLRADDGHDRHIQSIVSSVLTEVSEATGESFELKKFFPYLADGSFLSLHEKKEELDPLTNNLPEWGRLYDIPFDTIKKLNIPSVNMGVYGKDGHKWTERVYKPYSFGVLPELIRKTTVRMLEEQESHHMPKIG
ncbi:M20/M25/M40 family metallo-hydrolase [Sporosarcina sp. PTS2304]|uniref:M20/M25/M40 family metallo-hydrolase n=1 Tax=Sporosarcina sp. PTS2304 TaxID=2283194 RepID=UPI000E0CD0EA|nr:M20/M25/M40 family metallo-hydrolase [Sporosarcina sp. PTS2304]AXH98223.1 M20/M25/M40 family metallo-hydrolase [Sporosarcina sp. PTS2304]